ncbi:CLUMA_CG008474, isoform A [Clunio marinus]|uniref:CLUMA_CG008474, isoform A n=1 Tax=Clunio marinus TaxID=568069 RepID=A0A1J1I5G6_9DIPT|nr:CLUMA_CG008474, isoform A [Clunio marinus]
MSETTKQIVIVGDGTVGKTCLLHSYSNESFLESYVPTVYEKEVFDLELNGVVHTVKLIDTAGQEEYERVRKLFYKEANCFILCYDVSNRNSFTNIMHKWVPELQNIDSWPVPIVLVATKVDLRENAHRPMISTQEGQELSRKMNAYRFVECSAKENIRITDAIHEAVRAAVKGPIMVNDTRQSKPSFWGCCQR